MEPSLLFEPKFKSRAHSRFKPATVLHAIGLTLAIALFHHLTVHSTVLSSANVPSAGALVQAP